MKRLLLVLLVFVLSASISPEVSAQLVAPDNCPSGVCNNEALTSSEGYKNAMAIHKAIMMSSAVLTPLGLCLVIFGVVRCFHRRTDKSKKRGIFLILGGIFVILLPIIVLIIAQYFLQVEMGVRPAP